MFDFSLAGCEDQHYQLRQQICDVDFPPGADKSDMRVDGEWGSDHEIICASHLLNCDIYVHQDNGTGARQWHLYKSRLLMENEEPRERESRFIYLIHQSDHYEVVLRV